MKSKIFYATLFVTLTFMMSACTNTDDEISGNDTPPVGALPSNEFNFNNLPNERYSEDAIRIVVAEGDLNAPFYALELMPDGHYLLTQYNIYKTSSSVNISKNADGKFSICKSYKDKNIRMRSITDEFDVIDLGYGEYGTFTKIKEKKYSLSNGAEIDLQNVTGSDKKITYINRDGSESNVYVSVSEAIMDNATKSLCREWNFNSVEVWGYLNGKYFLHGKQALNNGHVDTSFNTIGGDFMDVSKDDIFDSDDECLCKVKFTTFGTYICHYINGEVEISHWQWEDKMQGTLHYEDSYTDENYDEYYDGFVTVRFANKQMRIYEDYSETEDGLTTRSIAVHTLTAAN